MSMRKKQDGVDTTMFVDADLAQMSQLRRIWNNRGRSPHLVLLFDIVHMWPAQRYPPAITSFALFSVRPVPFRRARSCVSDAQGQADSIRCSFFRRQCIKDRVGRSLGEDRLSRERVVRK